MSREENILLSPAEERTRQTAKTTLPMTSRAQKEVDLEGEVFIDIYVLVNRNKEYFFAYQNGTTANRSSWSAVFVPLRLYS